EFALVRSEAFEDLPRAADAAPGRATAAYAAIGGEPWLEARRVAEIGGVAPGQRWLRARLTDTVGALVAERLVTVAVSGNVVVTLVITRDCVDVACPGPGDPSSRTTCFAGHCVEPTCSVEHPEACGDPECTTAAECPAPAASCAEAA